MGAEPWLSNSSMRLLTLRLKSDRKLSKKLIGYIKKDKLRKLKKALRSERVHPDSCLNRRRQTGLHLSSKYGHPDCISVFMALGADPGIQDDRGNLGLHYASKYCLKNLSRRNVRDLTSVDDLALLDRPNDKGVTCRVLLEALNRKLAGPDSSSSDSSSSDDGSSDSFEDKLRDVNAEDEYLSVGKYEAFGSVANEYMETYDEWADRIYEEYQRRYYEKIRPEKDSGRRRKDVQEQSRAERKLVLKIDNKKEDKMAKKIDALFTNMDNSDSRLTEKSMPFGVDSSPDTIVDALLSQAGRASSDGMKTALRAAIRKWHPDKFMQAFGDRIPAECKDNIAAIVTHVSQVLLKYGKK